MSCLLPANDGILREIKFEEAAAAGGLEGRIADIVHANREEIERRYPKIMRRVSGYNLDEFVRNGKFNLSKLVVGSEGTLAAVHQAKVRIEPRPPATALMCRSLHRHRRRDSRKRHHPAVQSCRHRTRR